MPKLDFKTALILVLAVVSIGSAAYAITTYYGTGSFLVHVSPAPGINASTISVSPSLVSVSASAGGNFSEGLCFVNRASSPVTVFFNYSVSPPPGGSFSDVVWQLPASISLSGNQNSCSAGYPIVVSPNAVSGDYNVSVTYSWSG